MNAEDEPVPPARCDIVACDPPRLLSVRLVDDVGTWNLVATLSESAHVTTVTLTQIVDDPKMIENTGPGWEYYLDRLVATQTGADPAAVVFADYYPAQRDYYLAIADQAYRHTPIRNRRDPVDSEWECALRPMPRSSRACCAVVVRIRSPCALAEPSLKRFVKLAIHRDVPVDNEFREF